ncbi:hypothetical protein LJC30_01305 [Odoribacter sp. OttesenSCG-928-L07]|nr:hypothetical protein [Odoribacter sp. OttesenSCG-928-L07]MDL2239597.1 hypothetical protein [Bacteroidales bacterium OttesenSCG-928-L14]MDL2240759.1 hypothetical protein [Bacteroidales bacterium OttesenSCG-928-K22]
MKLEKQILILFLTIVSNTIHCQVREINFGKSTLCSQVGITAINNNISGLTVTDNLNWMIGINQTYSIPELWNISASYIPKIKKRGTIPITIACHGPGNFINAELKAGYSHQFTRYFSAGIRFTTNYYLIKESQNMFNVGFEIGATYFINEKISLGVFSSIPNLLHNTTENRWKNITIETALSYYLFEKASIHFGVRKQQYTDLEIITSIACHLVEKIALFIAYNSGNQNISTGISINSKNINIALMVDVNFKIGVTPEIQIAF